MSTIANDLVNISKPIDVTKITIFFFILVLLMATQDIAVDGWALTMLSKSNISYASTCQTIGLSIGYFVSYTIFLALNSPEFCNSYLRQEPSEEGILSLGQYMWFWGVIYIIVTVLIALFKTERKEYNQNTSIVKTYRQMFFILSLPSEFNNIICY